jgi:SAM-dependent methyltransferase
MSQLFEYDGVKYPDYIRNGNAMQFIAPTALQFCKGRGLDIGAGKWPLPGARPIDKGEGFDALGLPGSEYDYIFSSHCLEHLTNPVAALEHWKTRLRLGGVLFLYLPAPEMKYWQPTRNRRHLHTWTPAQMAEMLRDLGFVDVIHGERDLAWSFACIGFKSSQRNNE